MVGPPPHTECLILLEEPLGRVLQPPYGIELASCYLGGNDIVNLIAFTSFYTNGYKV